MKVALVILFMLALDTCQYRQRAVTMTPPKEVALQLGCSAKTKTVNTLIDQL